MADKHLSIDDFFIRLTTLFDSRRNSSHGSIYLTQKRLTHTTSSDSASDPSSGVPFPDLSPSNPLPIIIRATNGKSKEHRKNGEKIKLSTIVQPDDVEGFFVRYAEVMKAGTSSLKKRDRSGRKKKEKERQKAKKK